MYVSIGGPIFLIAVGAILNYATDFDIASVDMNTVGVILMVAGAAALVLSLALALFNRPSAPDDPRNDPRRSDRPPPPPR
ncbi:MAG TPA: DUF6458 family protein [Solirubrobacterales bacterium]|nr:DUF6458 family protein [Solirubrobacterales bacterium]